MTEAAGPTRDRRIDADDDAAPGELVAGLDAGEPVELDTSAAVVEHVD